MDLVTLGRTGITVSKNGFGALPIQRVSFAEAAALVRRALDGGITLFDTARAYTDSEDKLGEALRGQRHRVYLTTKTAAVTAEGFWSDLHESLRRLGTDYVDVYQFHNPAFCPAPGDGSGLWEAMEEAIGQGKVRFAGLTNHRMAVARQAVESGRYDILQYPFCYLATPEDEAVVRDATASGMGVLAMKGLSGGLLTNSAAAYAYLSQFDGVLPIWGVQRQSELDEFLSYQDAPPRMTPELRAFVQADRGRLAGDFCRSCGYCMPCPAGIEILNCARMSQLIRRAPAQGYFSPQWQEKMARTESCLGCGRCRARCPYGLDVPALLRKNYADYRQLLAAR